MIESLLLQTVEQSASNAKGMHWYKKMWVTLYFDIPL